VAPALRRVNHADGREALLQPRIMQVLVALLRADGTILTRHRLTELCWDGVVVGEDAINRVIGQLRRLSEGLGAGVFEIETITKVGYRIVRTPNAGGAGPEDAGAATRAAGPSICVLPFTNMSGDVGQDYLSDGVTEDVITDLGKVSALSVTPRNTAFTLKGQAVDVANVARRFGVSHVLEGSVRQAGGRVRISAQLTDAVAARHVWAERWDRDLTDIFALQDEISQAVVAALRLKLLAGEQQAIARRGTASADAYMLFLQARRLYVDGNRGDRLREEAISRLARKAIEIDPAYARAWALLALAQVWLAYTHGEPADEGVAATARALALDPDLAEAHAVQAKHLAQSGDIAGAFAEVGVALRLDADSYEANEAAGLIYYRQGRVADATRHFERTVELMDSDFCAPGMLISCYGALGDVDRQRHIARTTIERGERALAQDASNGSAAAFVVGALAALDDAEAATQWIERTLKFDAANPNVRYNFACALLRLADDEAALDQLEVFFAGASAGALAHAAADPDLDHIRAHPRFIAMSGGADARLATA